MDLEWAKKHVEQLYDATMPPKFIDPIVMKGLTIDLIEPGRLVCSFTVPPRLLNSRNSLHGGATATLVDLVGSVAILTLGSPSVGVSVDINVSYVDGGADNIAGEEIQIEANVLGTGKAVATAVVSVELRRKKTGKIFAQGRHTKLLPNSIFSKM